MKPTNDWMKHIRIGISDNNIKMERKWIYLFILDGQGFFCRFLSTQQGKVISVLKRTNDSEVCFCLSAFAHSTRWRLLTLESLGAHTVQKPFLLSIPEIEMAKISIWICTWFSKNQNGKIQLLELDFSNLMFQQSSTDR